MISKDRTSKFITEIQLFYKTQLYGTIILPLIRYFLIDEQSQINESKKGFNEDDLKYERKKNKT